MSILLKNGKPFAETDLVLKSGQIVDVAFETCVEAIDANRDVNLVNSCTLKASNAKKFKDAEHLHYAKQVNDIEFLEFVLIGLED